MPIENELKYILSLKLKEQAFSNWKKVEIKQGYLDDGPRIRKYGDDLVFTYKKWVESINALVEIENKISQKDFDYLFPMCTDIVRKTRFVKNNDGCEWVVDFLKNEHDDVYFILAEVEMPEEMESPTHILKELKSNVILIPEKGDKKFTNKMLSNESYAKIILQGLE